MVFWIFDFSEKLCICQPSPSSCYMLYFVFLVLPYSLSLNVVAHDVIKRLARSVFISLCGFESAMDRSTSLKRRYKIPSQFNFIILAEIDFSWQQGKRAITLQVLPTNGLDLTNVRGHELEGH